MRDIETHGTLNAAADGQISENVWAGLTRAEALEIINGLPARYSSPIYFNLARLLLLSDAPSLPEQKVDPKQSKDAMDTNPDRPDILIARLDKLLEMGALRDAQALYDTVIDETPSDFDLVYRNLLMLMLRGQLSAACLDVQAMQGQHGAKARWKDLSQLCRIQFANGTERQRLLGAAKFEALPKLQGYLRGTGFGNFANMSTEDLAYAVALGVVSPSSIAQLAPKAGAMQPLLLSVLIALDTPSPVPERMCLAIEGASRGLVTTRDLITWYEKPHYESALLLDQVGQSPASGSIHPCMVPTVLYQRIASNIKTDKRDAAMREALDVTKDLPDAALWPMALYFEQFDVKAARNKPYVWRLARIIAYEKGELPNDWFSGWGREGGQGVSPFWPIQAVVKPEIDSDENVKIWQDEWPSQVKSLKSRDPELPRLLSRILSGNAPKTGEKTKTNLTDYENNFSLTFSRSYAMPSYGLTQRLGNVIEKGQTGLSIALLLIGYGAIPPDQVIPHQMALVIESMNKAGFAQYARRFALEVLQ